MIDVNTDMQSKKSLFIISTPMQLITALHLIDRYKLYADAICLSDHLPNADAYGLRLQKIRFFSEVKVLDVRDIDLDLFKKYDEIFVVNYSFLKMYGVVLKELGIQVIIYDEGTLNYINDYIEQSYNITGCNIVYLYEPTLANYYEDSRFDIKQIPKIEAGNQPFLYQLNQIFNINLNEYIVPDTSKLQIFFSQPLEYKLSKKAKIRKFLKLFQSRSNWEYALEILGMRQEDLIKKIRGTGITLYRKVHPRENKEKANADTLQKEYPWELYLLNHPDINVVQYSLFSSVLTASFVLGEAYHLKSYYLYPSVVNELDKYGDVGIINKELLEFFNRLIRQGKVIPVESMEALERICQNEI